MLLSNHGLSQLHFDLDHDRGILRKVPHWRMQAALLVDRAQEAAVSVVAVVRFFFWPLRIVVNEVEGIGQASSPDQFVVV
jgi:hypothetical protein